MASQAAIAAISGLMPTMFMTRVMLQARTEERHLCPDLRKRLGQEVRGAHARLDRAEWMLDRLATLAHGLRVRIKTRDEVEDPWPRR
jgi:hypothetical protein